MIDERSATVLLALYDALLGAIPGHLRAITARWDETSVHFDCYFDGEITDDDQEAMEIVEADLSANFPAAHTVSHARHLLNFPAEFPDSGRFIFHRREDLPPFPEAESSS